ncbi:hypothetical protein OUZ56_007712 [Daphnia magna]|uniref:Uncharacterized protein n=1 Tax=Daphnia magna TaxID=35525 RepID=A0ABR0AAS5_9CRUS|nr:hypothetical protein OUZ56_007712 [Daphnia magna]
MGSMKEIENRQFNCRDSPTGASLLRTRLVEVGINVPYDSRSVTAPSIAILEVISTSHYPNPNTAGLFTVRYRIAGVVL